MTNIKYQAILKNGKNGSKLFNNPTEALKFYPNQIQILKEVNNINFDKIKTGNRNKKGRQFLQRSL